MFFNHFYISYKVFSYKCILIAFLCTRSEELAWLTKYKQRFYFTNDVKLFLEEKSEPSFKQQHINRGDIGGRSNRDLPL